MDLRRENAGLQNPCSDSATLVYFHVEWLLSCYHAAFLMQGSANAIIAVVVSKSVHDHAYKRVLVEEVIGRLSLGNTAEKALAVAFTKMLSLAGTLGPDTVKRIPSEYHGHEITAIAARIGYGRNSLTESLSSFVFGKGTKSTAQINKNVDIESQMAINDEDAPKKASGLSTEANLVIAGFSGTGIAGLMASGAKHSPFFIAFALASGMGFIGSFLAAQTANKPKLSNFLRKVGSIGCASAFMVALGNTLDTVMFGYVNVNVLVISVICVINAGVLIFGT